MILLSIAQTIPEINNVIGVFIEEYPEILDYSNRLMLIGMRWWIKDSFCQVNRISNDYDIRYVRDLNCLIDFASNSEQLCLSWHNIDSIMNSFGNDIITWLDMQY